MRKAQTFKIPIKHNRSFSILLLTLSSKNKPQPKILPIIMNILKYFPTLNMFLMISIPLSVSARNTMRLKSIESMKSASKI